MKFYQLFGCLKVKISQCGTRMILYSVTYNSMKITFRPMTIQSKSKNYILTVIWGWKFEKPFIHIFVVFHGTNDALWYQDDIFSVYFVFACSILWGKTFRPLTIQSKSKLDLVIAMWQWKFQHTFIKFVVLSRKKWLSIVPWWCFILFILYMIIHHYEK